MPEVDDDQLAALRRLRVAFGPSGVVAVTSHDPGAVPDRRSEEADPAGEGPVADDA